MQVALSVPVHPDGYTQEHILGNYAYKLLKKRFGREPTLEDLADVINHGKFIRRRRKP